MYIYNYMIHTCIHMMVNVLRTTVECGLCYVGVCKYKRNEALVYLHFVFVFTVVCFSSFLNLYIRANRAVSVCILYHSKHSVIFSVRSLNFVIFQISATRTATWESGKWASVCAKHLFRYIGVRCAYWYHHHIVSSIWTKITPTATVQPINISRLHWDVSSSYYYD